MAACSFSSPHFNAKSGGAFGINIIFLIMIDYNTTHNNKMHPLSKMLLLRIISVYFHISKNLKGKRNLKVVMFFLPEKALIWQPIVSPSV